MYGRNFDFSIIKHTLRDAMLLQRKDLPATAKPTVSREKRIFLKRVLNACHGFNIPLLVDLLEIKIPDVHTHNMCSTGYVHYRIQTQGGNEPSVTSERMRSLRINLIKRRKGSTDKIDIKTVRKKAIGHFFRALKCQHKLYGKNMGSIRKAFYKRDTEKLGTLTHSEFCQSCHDLGLGLTTPQLETFIAAVDMNGQGVIGYDEVLKPLHMGLTSFKESEVPTNCSLLKMRKSERIELMKNNELNYT
jgi:hypothetical protein